MLDRLRRSLRPGGGRSDTRDAPPAREPGPERRDDGHAGEQPTRVVESERTDEQPTRVVESERTAQPQARGLPPHDAAPAAGTERREAPADQEHAHRHEGPGHGDHAHHRDPADDHGDHAGGATGASVEDVRARQRDEFGGLSLGSAFFGWLVATGLGVILLALAAAAGTAIGLSANGDVTGRSAGSVGALDIVGAIVVLLILFAAYYCGGYVAGRMSRFDGARQGFAVWAIGILVALLLAAAGAIFGAEYNVLAQLNLPRIPVQEGELATGGAIALAAWLLATLIGAILGGKVGERFHRKVDRVGLRG